MTLVLALHDRALLDQRPEGPALQPAIGGASALEGQLRYGFEGMAASQQLDPREYSIRASSFALRAELCPLFWR